MEVLQQRTDDIMGYQIPTDPTYVLDAEIAKAIQSLWDDPIIPLLMERSSEFYLMDSAH